MTHKAIALKFVVLTVLAVALGIMISVGAVHLKDRHPVAIDRAEANAELKACSFRAFTCCFSLCEPRRQARLLSAPPRSTPIGDSGGNDRDFASLSTMDAGRR
jgi:hypothetical protein